MRYFPTLGSFLFWTVWPYLIARVTRMICVQFMGSDITDDNMKHLRKELATITKPVMRSKSSRDESKAA